MTPPNHFSRLDSQTQRAVIQVHRRLKDKGETGERYLLDEQSRARIVNDVVQVWSRDTNEDQIFFMYRESVIAQALTDFRKNVKKLGLPG